MGRIGVNLVGKKFNRLTVLQENGRSSNGGIRWLCKCDCGKLSTVKAGHLVSNKVKSCGCFLVDRNKEIHLPIHGHAKRNVISRTYSSWEHMKSRCLNKNDKKYPIYGERGIKVCDRWLKFENFLADMGECPEGLSIERIDNNGNYEFDNCKWATCQEQMNNTRRNVYVEHLGNTYTVAQLARHLNIHPKTLHCQLRKSGRI